MSVLRPLIVAFSTLTATTGLFYPALMTGLAQAIFPKQAQGSLLWVNGQVRGSTLIGQATEDPAFFWGRPSLTSPYPTQASASAGSTLAPSNPALGQAIARRIEALRASNPGQTAPIPRDLISASASGLDPHISPEAAWWQAPRIARARGLALDQIFNLVEARTHRPLWGPVIVNVLELNAALDGLSRKG